MFSGDPDENVYVVQNGKVNVYITGPDNSSICLKVVKTGESVTSLLSFIDVLTGHINPYKTVSARAVIDSTVVRLPMAAFQEVFEEYPDIFIRVMQVIMVRLQRVTFTALHQYLGLSAELVNPGTHKKRNQTSPVRSRKGEFQNESQTNSYFDTGPSSSGYTQEPFENWQSQPVNIPSGTNVGGHRRSQSNVDMKYHQSAPDMVPEFEQRANVPPDVHTHSRHKRLSNDPQLDEDQLIEIATEAFVRELQLDDAALIKGKVNIREVPAGTYLMKEESNKVSKLDF